MQINATTWRTPNISRHTQGPLIGQPITITPQGILLHSTEGSALSSLRWLTNPKSHVSCNYVVTEAGTIYQLADDHHRTWHGGEGAWDGIEDLNLFLGIEIVHKKGQGTYPQRQVDAVIWLCQQKIEKYGFTRSRITLHRWAAQPKGRKEDPTDLTDEQAQQWISRMFAESTLPGMLRRYKVIADVANIRQDYTTKAPIAGQLRKDEIFVADLMRFGEAVSGKNGWLHDITERGFVHESVLEEIT